MTPTSTQGPVRQNLTRHHLVASRAVCTFVDRGDSQCDLRGPGAATRFVLREQLSYGDNFMMFWEMIFRVILAYLRKLASQPRGRSASVRSHGLEPIKSYCRGQRIDVSRADGGADAKPRPYIFGSSRGRPAQIAASSYGGNRGASSDNFRNTH